MQVLFSVLLSILSQATFQVRAQTMVESPRDQNKAVPSHIIEINVRSAEEMLQQFRPEARQEETEVEREMSTARSSLGGFMGKYVLHWAPMLNFSLLPVPHIVMLCENYTEKNTAGMPKLILPKWPLLIMDQRETLWLSWIDLPLF